jgi:hypothetical protein
MDGPTTEHARLLLRWFKEGPPGAIPIDADGRSLGSLQAVSWEDAGDLAALEQLTGWHETAFARYPEATPVSPTSVRRWLVEQVLPAPDRVLFWVRDVRGERFGHAGLSRLDPRAGTAAISDVVAANVVAERLVNEALTALTAWARGTLGVEVLAMPSRRAA